MRAILTYHSIDPSESVISVHPEVFRRQMTWLSESGTMVLPLRDLPAADGDAIALTFDDGFANFADVALPILEELHFPATLFVVSGRVGALNDWGLPAGGAPIPALRLMGWADVERVAERGVEIGAHGRRHLNLATAAPADVSDEILGAATDIARETGRPPAAFAYPYGEWNDMAAADVSRAYQLSCTTEFRLLARSDRAHLLPRLDMYYLRAAGRLETFGTPRFARYIRLRRVARGVRRSLLRLSRG